MMNVEALKMDGRAVRWALLALIVVLSLSLAACSLPGVGGGGGAEATPRPTERPEDAEDAPNVLPTAAEAEDVGGGALSGAKESYQETWNNYLRDIIAEQVADRQQKLELLQRYENPRITSENAEGLVNDIDLVEDRTTFNVTGNQNVAGSQSEFDVRVTYLNGDTETLTCSMPVQIELNAEDGLWYVLNPAPLQVFAVCQP